MTATSGNWLREQNSLLFDLGQPPDGDRSPHQSEPRTRHDHPGDSGGRTLGKAPHHSVNHSTRTGHQCPQSPGDSSRDRAHLRVGVNLAMDEVDTGFVAQMRGGGCYQALNIVLVGVNEEADETLFVAGLIGNVIENKDARPLIRLRKQHPRRNLGQHGKQAESSHEPDQIQPGLVPQVFPAGSAL